MKLGKTIILTPHQGTHVSLLHWAHVVHDSMTQADGLTKDCL